MPELDGVRGVAILCVFMYHAVRGLPHIRWHEQLIHDFVNSGWVGVDLFFVLSGFLITGILIDAKETEGYFRRFYARRALRILPLYLAFIVLVLYIVPAIGLASPQEAAQLHRLEPWYWAHSVNILVALSGWSGAPWNTGHLWSLAVEEQFYLLWPAVVFVLTRRGLLKTSVALIAVAALLRASLVLMHVSPTVVYVLLPTRMDSLATGAALAVLAREPLAWPWVRRAALPFGAAMAAVVAAIIYQQGNFKGGGVLTQLFGYSAVAGIAGAMVTAAVGAPRGSLPALVWNQPVLRFFGRYSYGMYIWHHVVIPLLRHSVFPDRKLLMIGTSHLPGYILFTVVSLAATVGVSLVSWYVIEAPFLRLKRFVPRVDRRFSSPREVRASASSSDVPLGELATNSSE